ncbi:MAG: hypothetical protein LBR08_00540 [Bacteroidales bacterium]|nr:hypothetical protein [Bacteroidales bacterium]
MKKIIMFFAMFLATVFIADAQLLVGASLEVDYGSEKEKTGNTSKDIQSTFGISLNPKIGFYLNDQSAVGIAAGVGIANMKQPGSSSDKDVKGSELSWELAPFFRYSIIDVKSLALLLESSVGIAGASYKYKSGAQTLDGTSVFHLGVSVLPVLSYSLTGNLNIEASCDILRVGFLHSTRTTKKGEVYVSEERQVRSVRSEDLEETTSKFGLGVNGETTPVNIGILYKF